MMLRKRIARAMEYLKNRRNESSLPDEGEVPLEKGDMKAMIISALLVFLPIALATLLVMVLLAGLWLWL